MFKSIINFKAVGLFLSNTAHAGKQAAEALDNSADVMLKKSEINREKALEKYKKHRAQMIKDGGYESEEAMDKEHKRLLDEIYK